MKKIMQKMVAALLTGVSIIISSCNSNVENLLNVNYPEVKKETAPQSRVLWIVINGANGKAMRQAINQGKAENIRGMLNHAVYSLDGLGSRADEVLTASQGWSQLMSGSSVQASQKDIIQLVTSTGKTASLYASTNYVYEKYKEHASYSNLSDDEGATTQAIKDLGGDAPNNLSIVELSGVEKVGLSQGWFDEADNYATDAVLQAIGKADQQVGRLLMAVEARADYKNEKWLIMVTSNYGGSDNHAASNVYDRLDRKTFSLMYSRDIEPELLARPSANEVLKYEYFTPRYNGKGDTDHASVNDASLFNFDYDAAETDTNKVTNYTVQFMYRELDPLKKGRGVMLVSKSLQAEPKSGQGWAFRRRQSYHYCRYNGTTVYSTEKSNAVCNDGLWHVYTIVFNFRKKVFSIYKDGQLNMHGNKTKALSASLSTADQVPLTIGKIYGSSSDANTPFYVTNLQVYDVALPQEWIEQNYKMTYLDEKGESFKYWNNLIGYWPCDREDEYKTGVLHDYSKYGSMNGGVNAGRSDMTITNPTWDSGSDASENVSPRIETSYYQKVINTIDLSLQTLQWLGIAIDEDWHLEGLGRAFVYE